MTPSQPTRLVVKQFKVAGWTRVGGRGSHSKWVCPTGQHKFQLTDGHRSISPGVYDKAVKALAACAASHAP
ncbi:MAG: type II toxin-antitoxin system HicA family toxin [Angustibacter sp.]